MPPDAAAQPTTRPDAWDPSQYHRFAAERRQPFDDLLRLIAPVPGGTAVDLGCGTGELTLDLHRHVRAARTLGLDVSAAMLAKAPAGVDGVRFERGDLAGYEPDAPVDVIAANASLQWVPDHPQLLARLRAQLAPGGQLAVQVPANADHPSHRVLAEVAAAMLPDPPVDPVAANVLAPEAYAALLHDLGFAEQHVRLQVYGHVLGATADVVEWTRGTSLTRFAAVLDQTAFEELVARYAERLTAELGDRRPFFYPFKRILLWGRLAR